MSDWAWFFRFELDEHAGPFSTIDDGLIDRAMAAPSELVLPSLYTYQFTQLEEDMMCREVPALPQRVHSDDPDPIEPYLIVPMANDWVAYLAGVSGREKRWIRSVVDSPRTILDRWSELCRVTIAKRQRLCVLFCPELIAARPHEPRERRIYFWPGSGLLVG